MYKVVMEYPDGTKEEVDEIFETDEAARQYGVVECDSYVAGAEVLHLHNPGDYPQDEDDAAEVDFDVIEVDA